MRRRLLVTLTAAIALIAAAVLLVHAPFVRARILRYAASQLEQRYRIHLEASRLDYNLTTLRIGLADLRVSAAGKTPPFFEADYAAVVVPWRALFGDAAIDDVAVTNGRARILSRADGSSNLPESTPSTGEPAPLRVGKFSAGSLRVDVRDDSSGFALDIPAAQVELTHDAGRVALAAPATLRLKEQSTRLASVAGGARFDGRTLGLTDVDVVADEGRLRVNGTLTVIASKPALDLTIAGTADAARLARWGMAEGSGPRGEVAFKGRVQGPLAEPTAHLELAASRLSFDTTVLSDLKANIEASTDNVGGDVAGSLQGGHADALFRLSSGDGAALTRLFLQGRIQLTTAATPFVALPLPGQSDIYIADGRWSLSGRHRVGNVAPATIALGGRLNADDLDASTVSGSVQVGDSDLPALIGALRRARLADVPADVVAAGRVHGNARVAGTFGRARITFDAASDRVEIADPAAAGPATVAGTFDSGSERYTFDVSLPGWRLSSDPSGTFDATITGAGRGAQVSATGDVAARDVAYQGRTIGAVDAHLDLRGTTANITASIPRFAAALDASVGTAAPYPATVDTRVDNLDLARLVEGIETPVSLAGATTLTAHATGPLNDWRRGTARVDVQSLDAKAGELPIRLSAPAALRYDAGRVNVDSLEIAAGGTNIAVSGGIATESRRTGPGNREPGSAELVVVANGDLGELAKAVAATGLTELPVTGGNGPVALLARVGGSLEAPAISADVEVGPGSVTFTDMPAIAGLRLRSHVEDGWLDLREAEATYQDARVSASGRIPLGILGVETPGAATGDASLRARISGVTAKVLQPFIDAATVDEIDGSLDATVSLDAPSLDLDAARGELQIDRLELRVADLPIAQTTPTRIGVRDGFARIEAWDWTGQGASVDVRGQVRLADRQVAILANGTADLRMLTPFVRAAGLSTAGTLQPRLSITGDLSNPRIDGDLLVSNGEMRLADPRVVVSDLSGRVVLTRSTATLTTLTGGINGGTLTSSGTAEYRPDGSLDVRLATDIQEMGLDYPAGLRSEANAALQLAVARAGEADTPTGRLSGTITVLQGSFREPLAVLTGVLANLRAARTATAASVEPPGLLDNLALDVRLVTDEDVIVDNNYGRFQVGGDLRAIGTAAAPALSGRMELREGGSLFVGRNVYSITSGTIDFANAQTIEPNLNLALTTRAGGEDINVALAGTPDTLGVTLQSPSDPSLGQADLTAMLLTGRKLDALASSDAAVIGVQVLGNLSADALGFAGRAIGLDTLRIGGVSTSTSVLGDASELTTQLDPTSRLTFGKAIGNNLDVTFSQSLREGDAQTWIIDWLPSRRINLRLVSDDEDLRTYAFRHDIDVGGRRAAASNQTPRRVETRLSAVTLSGDLLFPEARVRDVLKLKVGERFDFSEWQRDRDRLAAFYQEQGYLTARVASRRNGSALEYTIAPGPKTELRVSGATLSAQAMSELRGAWEDAFFDEFLQDEAANIARTALARDGYQQAQVTATLSTEGETRILTVRIVPGAKSAPAATAANGAGTAPQPPPTIHAATIVGPAPLPMADALSALGLSEGAPADPASIDAARRRLIALYRGEGFASVAVVTSPLRPAGDGGVDVAFTMTPGPRQVLADVAVEGNRAIDTDVVTRALQLPMHEPLRPSAWLAARTRVFDTGLFRRVDVRSEPIEGGDPSGDTAPMRVRVVVEEWPMLRARYGFQVAEERPESSVNGRDLVPGLSADVTRRTLFGRALTVGAAGAVDQRRHLGRVFFSAPTMVGLPVGTSLVAERSISGIEATTIQSDVKSLSFEQRIRTTPRLSLSYAYRYERNHTFDTKPNPSDLFPIDIQVTVGRITSNAAWDSRDDPADTTRGLFVSESVEVAAESLKSDVRYVRTLTQAYYFTPWGATVFASAARLGAVSGLGGQDVIPSALFFAGGSRTVRGVEENGLGERDFFGDPKGGEGLLVLNQEVRFPIYRWLRGVGFVDTGNVFPTPAVKFGGLETSVGGGVRLVTPFGVIRADLGKLIGPGAGEPSGAFFIGIGQAF